MVMRKVMMAFAVAVGVFILNNSHAAAQINWPPLFAVLDGGNEVSPAGVPNAGDQDGRGSFSATIVGNLLCYGLTVTNIAVPTAAHIHNATAGVNGAIVVPLAAPAAGNPGTSSGCVAVGAALLTNIRVNATAFYVNVHTGQFPNGAIRGQLF
jgi:CHRD domain-containing protein